MLVRGSRGPIGSCPKVLVCSQHSIETRFDLVPNEGRMAANPQANSQYETNKLPGFNKEPFDGKPVHFFDMLWFIPFIVACGNIQQDGWTLHQTYYGNDLGGINNPGGNAAQQAQHRLRVHRLYNPTARSGVCRIVMCVLGAHACR